MKVTSFPYEQLNAWILNKGQLQLFCISGNRNTGYLHKGKKKNQEKLTLSCTELNFNILYMHFIIT